MIARSSPTTPGRLIRRRSLLTAAGSVAASVTGVALLSSACRPWPTPTTAKTPRIGYLAPEEVGQGTASVEAFLDGLRNVGYVEGQNVVIEWRFAPAGSSAARYAGLAAELARLPLDIIVAGGNGASAAAKQATRSIPIVGTGFVYPLQDGLVASLARPGSNFTGAAWQVLPAKQLELLSGVVPGLKRVAALVNANATAAVYSVFAWDEIRPAAEQAGVQLQRIDLRSTGEVEAAFEAAAVGRADAVIGMQSPLLLPVRDRVAQLALQHQLPTMFEQEMYVAAGVLMSYDANVYAVYRRAAVYVDKILKGAKPGELPFEQPTTFDFVVNLKTVAALGLTVSPDVAAQVTEWIQ